jgi:hypothetical protein
MVMNNDCLSSDSRKVLHTTPRLYCLYFANTFCGDYCLLPMLGLLFHHKHGGSRVLQNVGNDVPHYTAFIFIVTAVRTSNLKSKTTLLAYMAMCVLETLLL